MSHLVGIDNFSGGEVILPRVRQGSRAMCERINGFDTSKGYLEAEKLVKKLNTGDALAGATPAQAPYALPEGGTTTIVARDANGAIRTCESTLTEGELVFGDWSLAGQAVAIIDDAAQVKLIDRLVYPTLTDLMVYEKDYTPVRPLSAKSPAEYDEETKPAITVSASEAVQLFDCDAAGVWTSSDGSCAVDNTETGSALLTLTAAPASTMLAKIDIDAADVSLSGKFYLRLDIMIQDDAQDYLYSGLFANDPTLLPSGYELQLWGSADCTTDLIETLPIPRCIPQGMVNRIIFRLENTYTDTDVQGVSIKTASYYAAPGDPCKITLYSGTFDDNWEHIGNFLFPPIMNPNSPMIGALKGSLPSLVSSKVPPTGNVVVNNGFEAAGTWSMTSCERNTTKPRTGAYKCKFDHIDTGESPTGYLTQAGILVTAGATYALDIYYRQTIGIASPPSYETVWQPKLTFNDGGVTVITFPDIADDTKFYTTGRTGSGLWYDPVVGYAFNQLQFTVPAGATEVELEFMVTKAHGDFSLDDVAIYMVDQAASGSAVVYQTFTPQGTSKTPATARLQYCFCNMFVDRQGTELPKPQISNPSEFSDMIYPDPWRTYEVEVAYDTEIPNEYDAYFKYFLIYRRIYTKIGDDVEQWSDWKFAQALSVDYNPGRWYDSGSEVDPIVDGMEIPEILELDNDSASTARYVTYANQRVYAGCLEYDSDTATWQRPIAIQVSTLEKPYAFPSSSSAETAYVAGTILDEYAQDGSLMKGLCTWRDDVYAFLDNELYQWRGGKPGQDFTYARVAGIGCKSAKSIAECDDMIIWHDGLHFYSYSGGTPQTISRFQIDSTLIDWTAAHGAVFCDGKYIFFCTYGSEYAMLIYDTLHEAWRIRRSEALTLAGICTDKRYVYGVTTGGELVDLFGSDTSDYNANATIREAYTRYIQFASPDKDLQVNELVLDVITDTEIELDIMVWYHGAKCSGEATANVTVTPDKTRYETGLNIKGYAAKAEITYTGEYMPDIHFVGFLVDEVEIQ